ncbi:hypothetical protein [Aquitalea sp.]|uniref:hypothetical protein n=1 Tax=Aquitalea sp. TaxID=1872623 RepID=UPI00258310B0|nr:hypothetical protein [Aquitalea sp.]
MSVKNAESSAKQVANVPYKPSWLANIDKGNQFNKQQSNNINAQIAETQKEITTLNQIGNNAVTTNIQHEQGDASNNAFTFAAEITGAKALGNVVLDGLAALGTSGAFGTLTKTAGSESNAGKLVWSELGADGKVLSGAAANPSVQSIVKQSASTVSPTVQAAQLRQAQMLQSDTGYNLSPIAWDSYPTIGRHGTYVTDQITINNYFGNISGVSSTTITKSQAAQIEVDMGLQPGSLQNGFKVRQVDSIQKMQPNSPLSGNEYFMGAGNHLPSGSPEMVIQSIPTTDTATVKTILNVKVQ